MNNADGLSRTQNAGSHQRKAESLISSIIPSVCVYACLRHYSDTPPPSRFPPGSVLRHSVHCQSSVTAHICPSEDTGCVKDSIVMVLCHISVEQTVFVYFLG